MNRMQRIRHVMDQRVKNHSVYTMGETFFVLPCCARPFRTELQISLDVRARANYALTHRLSIADRVRVFWDIRRLQTLVLTRNKGLKHARALAWRDALAVALPRRLREWWVSFQRGKSHMAKNTQATVTDL